MDYREDIQQLVACEGNNVSHDPILLYYCNSNT